MHTRIRMHEFTSPGFAPGVSRPATMSHDDPTTRRHPPPHPDELPPVSADSWPETIVGVSRYPKKTRGMASTSSHHYPAHNRRPQRVTSPLVAG